MPQNILCWTDIPITDLDRAIAFYAAVLDAPVLKQTMQGFDFALLPHAESNVSGCLVKVEENQPSQSGPLIYLSVDGRLDAAVEAAESHGGKMLTAKHSLGPHGFRAVVVDSEGNRIALHSQTA